MLRPKKYRLRLAITAMLLACSTTTDAAMPVFSLSVGDLSCRIGRPEHASSRSAPWQAALGQRIARALGAPQMARSWRHNQARAAVALAGVTTYLKGDS